MPDIILGMEVSVVSFTVDTVKCLLHRVSWSLFSKEKTVTNKINK
jgi:uncharacterized membrane protein